MAYIERAITQILKKRILTSKCLLITGARQVGKTTLIKQIFPEYNFVSFDNKLARLQANEEPNLFFLNNPCPLFIDEVQKEKDIFEEIKIRVDASDKRGNFILSGSQKLNLLSSASESLAGRVSLVELPCLSLREINKISFNKHFIPTDDYLETRKDEIVPCLDIWKTIHKGFYPELYDVKRDWEEFYLSYISTYLERDINTLIMADGLVFTKFMTCMAARTGQILNYANIASEVGVSEPTIKNWVSILERSGIIFILQPYHDKVLHRAIKSPKVYFRDTGLCSYLTKWQTADALKNITNTDIEIIEDLAESDLSVFDGMNIDLFEERIKNGYYKKITGTDNFLEAMGCESDEHIKKRIFNAVLTICKKTPYKTIAISSHGNILKKLLIQCNFPDTSKLSNCEIIEAEFNDGKLKIIKRIK